MHVQADLLNSVRDVGSGESEVLESTHKVAICCRIINRGAGISRNFGTSVNRSGTRLAVGHAMASKNVQSVLTL